MRARSLKPGFFQNEDLIELPFEYRLLFAGLWTMADREGRLEDRPKKIKLSIFPGDNVDCEVGLQALHDKGFIVRYQHEKGRFVQIKNWGKHQSPHVKEAPSTIPAPCEHHTSTVRAPDKPRAGTSVAALTPSSLTPDSGLLTPDSSSLRSLSSAAPPADSDPGGEQEVFEHWKRTWGHPNAVFDPKRRGRIRARLKNFTVDQLCDAISGFRNSPWHSGTDPKGQGKVYDGLDTLLRDTAQVEEGIRLLAHPPRAPPKPENATERILRALNGNDNSRTIEHEPEREFPALTR